MKLGERDSRLLKKERRPGLALLLLLLLFTLLLVLGGTVLLEEVDDEETDVDCIRDMLEGFAMRPAAADGGRRIYDEFYTRCKGTVSVCRANRKQVCRKPHLFNSNIGWSSR